MDNINYNTKENRYYFLILLSQVSIIYLISISIYAYETVKLSPKVRMVEKNIEEQWQGKFNEWRKDFLEIKILEGQEVKNTPRVVSDRKAKVMSVDGDQVYINKLSKINYRAPMAIYRIGAALKKPNSKDVLGYPMFFLADAKLKKYNVMDNLSLVELSSVGREILMGDRVLNKDKYKNIKVSKNKDKSLNGQIVSVVNGVYMAGKGQTVILDVGKKNGLKVGHLISAVKKPQVKRAIRLHEDEFFQRDHFLNEKRDKNAAKTVYLPPEPVATLIVYKAFENTSLALIVDSKESIKLNQKIAMFSKYQD